MILTKRRLHLPAEDELAARARVLQVGDITVAIDGTKILANASKHSAVSDGHAVEHMKLAGEQIAQLLQKQANDKHQLVPTLAVISPVIGQVSSALVDSGYYSENALITSESADPATHLKKTVIRPELAPHGLPVMLGFHVHILVARAAPERLHAGHPEMITPGAHRMDRMFECHLALESHSIDGGVS